MKIALKCKVRKKTRHYYYHKDPPFDMNHQLMSAHPLSVVKIDLNLKGWFLLFFFIFLPKSMIFWTERWKFLTKIMVNHPRITYFQNAGPLHPLLVWKSVQNFNFGFCLNFHNSSKKSNKFTIGESQSP